MKKKILMLLTRNPYPVDNGAKLKLSQTISFLKDNYHLSVMIFTKNTLNKEGFSKNKVTRLHKLYFPSKIELLKNIFMMKSSSLQERLFFSTKSKNIIEQEIKSFQPDLIYADMIRTAQYVENMNLKKVIDIEDIMSKRYQKFLEVEENSIFGTFNFLIPSIVRKPIENLFKKKILNYEINLISERERDVVKKFDASFLISEKERKELSLLTQNSSIYTNTLSVPLRKNIFTMKEKNNLLFIGNMEFAQNLSSLKMIINEVLPFLSFEYELFIIGKYDDRTRKMIKGNKNIKLLGFVDDLESILKDIKIAVMPISFGTGIKTKILDCMSYGIPVLTNDIGNEGLNTVDMHDIILVDTLEAIPSTLKKVLKDEKLLKRVSCNGYDYVNSNHSFEELKIKFNNHMENILYQTR